MYNLWGSLAMIVVLLLWKWNLGGGGGGGGGGEAVYSKQLDHKWTAV